MRFEFATVTKIIFGQGTLERELPSLVASFGGKALIIVGSSSGRAVPLVNVLNAQHIRYAIIPTSGEPKIDELTVWVRQAKEFNPDFVIAFGGGAVLDTGKAVAALLANPGDPLDYLEVIGAGKPIQNSSVPFIAIPTTAGTGSEVTSNAVLSSPEHRVKVSLRSPLMLPRLALVDSTLTHTTPPQVTAQSGLDAITQVLEPFVSNKANPITDGFCREGLRRGGRSMLRAYQHPDEAAARDDMALVSLLSGLALSNAKLGAVHGFAGPFGGMFDAPHGGICACLLPYVMDANIRALRERQPKSEAIQRYNEVAQLLTGDEAATADDGVRFIHDLCAAMQIRSLSAYGCTESDFPALIEKSAVASSMQGNPIKLTTEEMHSILAEAL